MRKLSLKALLATSTLLASTMFLPVSAHAKCTAPAAADDLTDEQVVEIYDCIREKLRAGYAKSDNEWAKEYTTWGATASRPANPGPHGGRFLNTFVNEVGLEEYLKFSDEREENPMPVGTIVAKESFKVNKKNAVKKGPLFFMEKVAAGTADEYGNWVYTAIQPNGKPVKASQKFCHDCHGAFSDQDALGYPDEDVRLVSEEKKESSN